MINMASKRFTLNRADIIGWGRQTLIFLAPYLIALIPVFIEQVPKDWEYAIITIWGLNRIWDLLRRFVAGK